MIDLYNEMNDAINTEIDQWDAQQILKNKYAADSTLDIPAYESNMTYNPGLQIGEYICHPDITYQQVSNIIDAIDSVFDPQIKPGKPIAKLSKDLAKNKMVVSTEPKKENVVLVHEGNTIENRFR